MTCRLPAPAGPIVPPPALADSRGAVVIEAAFALPIVILLLLGIVTYGCWFMAAHALQQAANDAARAALGGIDAAERQELVDDSLASGAIDTGTLDKRLVVVTTAQDGRYYTVSLSYDAARSAMFARSPVPLPQSTIRRSAVVQLGAP